MKLIQIKRTYNYFYIHTSVSGVAKSSSSIFLSPSCWMLKAAILSPSQADICWLSSTPLSTSRHRTVDSLIFSIVLVYPHWTFQPRSKGYDAQWLMNVYRTVNRPQSLHIDVFKASPIRRRQQCNPGTGTNSKLIDILKWFPTSHPMHCWE